MDCIQEHLSSHLVFQMPRTDLRGSYENGIKSIREVSQIHVRIPTANHS